MLVVKDVAKLKDFGFENTWDEKNIWRKKITPRDTNLNDGVWVELVVNPMSDKCVVYNEVLLYIYADTSDFHGRTEVDMLIDYDIIFELLIAGVIKYVPKEETTHGNISTDRRGGERPRKMA